MIKWAVFLIGAFTLGRIAAAGLVAGCEYVARHVHVEWVE